MKDNYIAETKVSKSQNGKSKSYTFSTVIPKPIVTKFGLDKGQKLYWDISDSQIIITPELPEAPSMEAGMDILNDFLINGNNNYSTISKNILNELDKPEVKPEAKIETILNQYGKENQEYFKQVVTYLLDYPLPPENHEILRGIYDEITKTD